MLKAFRKFLKHIRESRTLNSKSGQVAVILILITGFALIFYAVTLNLSRLSTMQAFLQNSADVGAAQMGSNIASYGQTLFAQQMGGRKKYCKWTNLLKALGFIFLAAFTLGAGLIGAILITAAFFVLQAALVALGAPSWLIITLSILTINIGLYTAAKIEPQITNDWNTQMSAQMGPTDTIVESAIQRMLTGAQSDKVRVLDISDLDRDRTFGMGPDGPKDTVARFAVYYNQRLKGIELADISYVTSFLDALEEFSFEGTDGWALFDPVDCFINPLNPACEAVPPAEYNPCCQPDNVHTLGQPRPGCVTGGEGVNCQSVPYDPVLHDDHPREECCDLEYCTDPLCPGEQGKCDIERSSCGDLFTVSTGIQHEDYCGTATTCAATTPFFGAGGAEPNPYTWVYDPTKEDYYNNFTSFREQLGEDDTHGFYRKELPLDPTYGPNGTQVASLVKEWRLEDATGYYTYPAFTDNDLTLGVLSMFDVRNYSGLKWNKVSDGCNIKPPGALEVSAPPTGLCAIGDTAWLKDTLRTVQCDAVQYPEPNGGWWLEYACEQVDDRGIFPFLYKIHDWGTRLGDFKPSPGGAPPESLSQDHINRCYWVDGANFNNTMDPDRNCAGLDPNLMSKELRNSWTTNFPLPFDPDTLMFNRTFWVDEDNCTTNCGSPDPVLLRVDKVTDPSWTDYATNTVPNLYRMQASDYRTECSQRSFVELETQPYLSAISPDSVFGYEGFWKRGNDRFCAPGDDLTAPRPGFPGDYALRPVEDIYVYSERCRRNGYTGLDTITFNPDATPQEEFCCSSDGQGRNCLCGEGPNIAGCPYTEAGAPIEFNEDIIDDLINGIPEFVATAKTVLQLSKIGIYMFTNEFPAWYQMLAPFIERYCGSPGTGCSTCFHCGEPEEDGSVTPADGALWTWLKEIRELKERLVAWRNHDLDRDGVIDPNDGFRATNDDLGIFVPVPCGPPGDPCCTFGGADPCVPPAPPPPPVNAECEIGWCVPHNLPPATSCPIEAPSCGGACPMISRQEQATFNINGNTDLNGTEWTGDLEDIVGCLDINTEGFDAEGGYLMRQCYNNCSNVNCRAMPLNHMDLQAMGVIVPYSWNVPGNLFVPTTFDETADCDFVGGTPVNNVRFNWNDEILLNIAAADRPNPKGSNVGNDWRFAECRRTCGVGKCGNLPRSLIPNTPTNANFDPSFFPAYDIRDEPDVAAMIDCFDNCSVSPAICQNMPLIQSSTGGVPYTWSIDPTTHAFTLADCATMAGDPITPGTWGFEINQNLLQAVPSTWNGRGLCEIVDGGTPATSSWIKNVEYSSLEAANQVAKFKQRRDFLKERLIEVDHAISFLSEAEQKFLEFLGCEGEFGLLQDGPACALIKERQNFAGLTESGGLPFHAVYGWQDEAKEGNPPDSGQWHIIKVDARFPGRCMQSCNAGQNPGGGDPEWPRIHAWLEAWGLKRCFKLINTEGVVKARITRYDEYQPNNIFAFPNGIPIWDFRFYHPERPIGLGGPDPSVLNTACRSEIIPDPRDGSENLYRGAFLLSDLREDNQCWTEAQKFLVHGVVVRSCVRYFYNDPGNTGWTYGTQSGMNIRFIQCAPF